MKNRGPKMASESEQEKRDTLADIVAAKRNTPVVGNAAAMREALEDLVANIEMRASVFGIFSIIDRKTFIDAKAALSAPPHKGKWENGTMYEYEYAYCSECGRMQWAGWDTHKQAKENIESFARDYKFCPGCGTEMDGGMYVQ